MNKKCRKTHKWLFHKCDCGIQSNGVKIDGT